MLYFLANEKLPQTYIESCKNNMFMNRLHSGRAESVYTIH